MVMRSAASTHGIEYTLSYSFVFLSLLMLYFPWGAVLHTSIAIPAHLGWALLGLTLLVMVCRSPLVFYRARLPLFGVILLALPVLWMPAAADAVAVFSRAVVLLLGTLLLSLLGGMSLSERQARHVGKALMLLAVVCALSVVVRRFWPELHTVWVPLAGGGWITGGFLQPDLMATFLASMLLVAVHLWILRGSWKELCLVALLMFSLALCQSVMGWLGGVTGLLLMLLACAPGYRRRLAVVMGVILAAASAGGSWLVFGLAQPLCQHLPWHSLVQVYQASEALWYQHPFLGVGYGRFEALFPEGVALAGLQSNFSVHGVVTHAGFEGLHWIVEGGCIAAIGSMLLFAWGVRLFSQLWRQSASVGGYGHEESDALGWAVSAWPLILATWVDNPWYQSPIHFLFFLLLAGLAIARLPKRDSQLALTASHTWILRATMTLIGLGTIWYALTGSAVAVGIQEARQVQAADIRQMEMAARFNPWYMRDAAGFARSLHQLQQFKENEKADNLAAGIAGLQHYVARHPDPNVYSLLITMLDIQGKTQEAESIYAQAQQRIPWDERFTAEPLAPTF